MEKYRIILNAVIFFYIIQRISEMLLSAHNEEALKLNNQASEVNSAESLKMKLFHTFWFISLIIESNINNATQSNGLSIIIYLILGACLLVRMHTMEKLRIFWTIKVLLMEKQKIITSGLYKYLRHPNYLVVILEFIFLPLLFKAYWTLIIFSILNFFVLYKRIKLEEETLMSQSDYAVLFSKTKRLIPYVFSLFLCFKSNGAELKIHSESYKQAKNHSSYIKFESISTKLGLFSSTFDGYAKDILIRYNSSNNEISKLEVEIPVKSLDTDVNSRNEKMYDDILNAKIYPIILVATDEIISLENGEKTINMIFTIKGNKITKPVKVIISKNNDEILIKGSANLGIKEMQLPDPSISIAKVRDNFDLSFTISI